MTTGFLDGYLPYLLRNADRLLSQRFHAELGECGLRPSQWRVLAVLREHEPLSIGELTRRTLMPQPTTTHAVDRLSQAGHVARQVSKEDGRLRIVVLTDQGRRTATELVEAADRALTETLVSTGATISATFVSDLRALIDSVEAPVAVASDDR